MSTPPAPWATPGATVYELHCSTRDYSTKKVITAVVARAQSGRIVLDNGARYLTIDGSEVEPIRYQRADPKNKNRYFLLIGPEDPKAPQTGATA
jgi:hypothetical protein